MKNLHVRGPLAFAVLLAGAACSSAPLASSSRGDRGDDDAVLERDGSVFDSAPQPDSGLGTLRFMPSNAFSGFDGEHTFQVPIAVYDASDDLEVEPVDPTAATIAPAELAAPSGADSGKYFLVTVKKAGPIALTAVSAGRRAEAVIHATAYEAGRWAAGQARYASAGIDGDPPCTRCHVEGRAIDHSPAAMASVEDAEIGLAITSGMKPGPSPITGVACGDCSEPGKKHRWQVSEKEKRGLVTYLRSLQPRGFR